MGKTSDSFLHHAISNTTQYSEGWRQICQELITTREALAELWHATNELHNQSFKSDNAVDWDRFKGAMDAARPDCTKATVGRGKQCILKEEHEGGCVW